MKRKKLKRLKTIPLLLLSLVVFAWGLPMTAYAAEPFYDPANYVVDVVTEGDTKTVYYSWDSLPWMSLWWDSNTNTYTYHYAASTSYNVELATQVTCTVYPFGVRPSYSITGGAIDVSELLPGSSIDFTCDFTFGCEWKGAGSIVSAETNVTFTVAVYYYDADGNWLGSDDISEDNVYIENIVSSGSHYYDKSLSGSIPVDAYYILPLIKMTCDIPEEYASYGMCWYLENNTFDLSVDINMIQEQSNMMQAVNDKLDDIGGKIDDTNEKLDQIITGGEAGEQLGGASDELTDSSNQVSESITGADDIEDDLMADVEESLDGIDVITGVGSFSHSVLFVSGYLQTIFESLEGKTIVIILPMFLGLVFGICSHIGGVTHVIDRAHNYRPEPKKKTVVGFGRDL